MPAEVSRSTRPAELREWQEHKGPMLDTINGFEVIDCQRCGFSHILPIPTTEELERIYRQEYYTVEKPHYLERHREDLDWWNLVYERRYRLFEKLLPPHRRRILDVGSGPGFFLLYGQQRGWETLGIEPSAQAAAASRQMGLKIIEGFLDRSIFEQPATRSLLARFDVVHLQEVLEHIPDPIGMLELIYNHLLNPGGLLCVVVPNDYNPLQGILCKFLNYQPWWLAPPHHINYFCFDSVERCIRAAGFTPLHRQATFPMEIFLLMGENYVGNDPVGRRVHGMRKSLELNLAAAGAEELLSEFYSALASRGLGRECLVVAAR